MTAEGELLNVIAEYIVTATERERNETIELCEKAIVEFDNRSKWIPVSERLPIAIKSGVSESVLCFSHANKIEIGQYDEVFEIWHNTKDSYKIIAWQPLPEPYKE